jgi:molybdenum cofactor cytidylyltransferase
VCRVIAALLLAAGRSQRFGADKLLAPLPGGTSLAAASLRTLNQVVDHVIAVVRPRAPVTPLLAAGNARIVVAQDADLGMGNSIAAGMRALMDDREATGEGQWISWQGCLIALADMPFVRPDTLVRLLEALREGASLVAPDYHGTRGHPVGFSHQWFPHLAALDGDNGARDLLAVHREALRRIPVDDPGVLADVDRPTDLEALI